jgi:cytochrome c peroxidase
LTWTEAGLTTLEAQAVVPVTGTKPVEMGMAGREADMAGRLNADPCYRRLFALAFPKAGGQVDFAKVTAALGAFQRTMISFSSPYDRYVAGNAHAISGEAAKGIGQFKGAGCAACHSGVNFTDDKAHYVGTAAPSEIFDPAYGGTPPPPGFEPPPENFRTPSLRNITVTGPWLHDGSADSIDAAIRRHAASSLGGVDMAALLAFLETLTDSEFLAAEHLSKPAGACPVKL